MYRTLDPVLNCDVGASWLTVGDGRYGRDAKYILEKNSDVIASDITDVLLKEAQNIGYIKKFSKENAESLSFADNTFDYVFCKESYHHFPRPMLALYEMLRVARKGIFLIEPNDMYFMHDLVEPNLYLHNQKRAHRYEDSGNYLYTISRREIEKVALGMNYAAVAFSGLNDAYEKGVEYEKHSDNGPLLNKIREKIEHLNGFSDKGVRHYDLLVAIIFKETPSERMSEELINHGFEIELLPKNPHL